MLADCLMPELNGGCDWLDPDNEDTQEGNCRARERGAGEFKVYQRDRQGPGWLGENVCGSG